MSNEPLDEIVQRMNLAIAHRGPDANGVYFEKNIALGHRRLSIIDTSDAGNQPFYSHDNKIVVVFNGEIYNYLELKDELASHYHFRTSSDTEVIIAAYLKWGERCVEHFIGMFAFALHDKEKDTTFLFRDRLGVKPLYIFQKENGLAFASEIRALIASKLFNIKISKSGFVQFLKFQTVHTPNTILENVSMLEPGHYLTVRPEGVSKKKYWSLENQNLSISQGNRREVQQEVRAILESAVEMRMRSDVPFGAFLSGGIDSSIIVGLMAKKSTHKVKTFSITFNEEEYDEGKYSRLIAELYNTDHTEIKLSANDFLELVPDAIDAMDHPSGDGPNTFVVSKVTKERGVKMTLSGLGGDELFAGYDVFKRMHALNQKKWLANTPKALRATFGSAILWAKPNVAGEKISELLKSEKLELAPAYKLSRQVWMDKSIQNLVKNYSETPQYKLPLENIEPEKNGVLSYVSKREMSGYMMDVLLRDSDQMSMAHALEIRVPFIDHRLVEYVLQLEDNLKFPHTPKELLVEACSDIIPREIVDRKKMGFTFPWAIWMKNELKPYAEEGLEALCTLDFIDGNQVKKYWSDFLNGSQLITWSRMWPLVVLGHWMKKNGVGE